MVEKGPGNSVKHTSMYSQTVYSRMHECVLLFDSVSLSFPAGLLSPEHTAKMWVCFGHIDLGQSESRR